MRLLHALLPGALLLSWDAADPPGAPWKEVRYSGRTRYAVVERGGERILRAESRDGNSALLHPLPIDPRGVTLRWRWRVLRHPAGADPEVRGRDDRAAGVLVIVRRGFLRLRTRAVLYQWTPARRAGFASRSPYSGEVRTIVLRDAPADSVWREESRDLAADLAAAFGAAPRRIEAVGVICDTDNTGAVAIAEFGALSLGMDPPAAKMLRPPCARRP